MYILKVPSHASNRVFTNQNYEIGSLWKLLKFDNWRNELK